MDKKQKSIDEILDDSESSIWSMEEDCASDKKFKKHRDKAKAEIRKLIPPKKKLLETKDPSFDFMKDDKDCAFNEAIDLMHKRLL